MKKLASALRLLLIIVCLLGIGFFVVVNYSYLFSHDVKGEIIEMERVIQPTAIIGNGSTISDTQLFSFAVAIKSEKGEIFTASSEDRKWAVAKKGYCVEARFYPYPPWNLEKAGTYFDARLTKLLECQKTPTTASAP